MRTTKVVKEKDVLKDHARILKGLEDRVKGIVVDVLSGIERNLSNELHGIALEVMKAVMEFEILEVAGPKGQHLPDRRFTRGGHNPGSVVIDGVKAPCAVPRVVEVESTKAHSLASYRLFHKAGEAVGKAYRALINGLSTRTFAEGVSSFVEGYGLSAATISLPDGQAGRHMIAATAKKVEELFTRSLAEIDLAVLMIDGIAVGDHTVVIALGIDRQGVKHILGLRQGATENTEVVKGLLEGLEDTLTVQRMHLPLELRRSLRNTNIIESTNNAVRHRSRNVKRWRGGMHVERWVAASLLETEKKFRRIKGCNHMQLLIAAVDAFRKQKAQVA